MLHVLQVGFNCGRGRELKWIQTELAALVQKFCGGIGKVLRIVVSLLEFCQCDLGAETNQKLDSKRSKQEQGAQER